MLDKMTMTRQFKRHKIKKEMVLQMLQQIPISI